VKWRSATWLNDSTHSSAPLNPANYRIRHAIYATLRLPDSDAHMIQINEIKRHLFIKMANNDNMLAVLRDTGDQIEYKYPTGQVSIVIIAMAGLGTKRIRVANLAPEVSHEAFRASLTPYGKILNIQAEKWPKVNRYAVENGVRQVTIMMTRHAPSHLTVAGHRALLSYEGQPATCYGCGEAGHMYQVCPARQRSSQARLN